MSSLISYAKAFNLPTTQDMSHIEIATLVANHFLSNTIDEAKVIQDFYVKTETIKNNPSPTVMESASAINTKRQSKKPKKYTQNEDTAYHYNTRSKVAESSNGTGSAEKETTEGEAPVQYCICGQPENDNMVQCENPNCKHKWFHYSCMNITDPETLPAKWYCPDCAKEHAE
ncbi:hypothetical protein WA538_002871 [Blastocystis sp. DL]